MTQMGKLKRPARTHSLYAKTRTTTKRKRVPQSAAARRAKRAFGMLTPAYMERLDSALHSLTADEIMELAAVAQKRSSESSLSKAKKGVFTKLGCRSALAARNHARVTLIYDIYGIRLQLRKIRTKENPADRASQDVVCDVQNLARRIEELEDDDAKTAARCLAHGLRIKDVLGVDGRLALKIRSDLFSSLGLPPSIGNKRDGLVAEPIACTKQVHDDRTLSASIV